ncbi:hypothetical protein THII_1821 [Thioploca ingrica]|uniref:Putative restriction endonuclease domain-containing protein n=1 Tax=Thioploca ingrica TaxID=40754 RepID=A0A090ADW0_9GAMM|nr:hypothetical protein THII_1821 [Thioploca ingrica]
MPTIAQEPTQYDDPVTEDEELLEPLAPQDWPPVDHLVTEDDTPVDNFPSAKQQRLLVESLYNAWTPPKDSQPFLADANIAIYYAVGKPPIVPDLFLSLDVQVADDWWNKLHRSYFVWMLGKLPDVVIEIVSNRAGQEADRKLHTYARMRVPYYVIFDPQEQLGAGVLRLYELRGLVYVEMAERWLAEVGIGLTLWNGMYENKKDIWLRWCDREGNLILTGGERAKQEHQRAEQERQRAEQEHQRAERLAEKLRALGIDPDSIK